MNPIQLSIDKMMAESKLRRSESQMTLGEMASTLASLPADMKIPLDIDPASYRGYYSDLAFSAGESTAGELAERAKRAIGEEFTGYKGGEFVMSKITPVWVAPYGSCGEKLIAINSDGSLVLADDEC